MSRIDFYVLGSTTASDRMIFTCRLVDKAYQLGHRIYIHTDNEGDAMRIDELLWTFRAASFVPHGRSDNRSDKAATAVYVGDKTEPQAHYDLLVNLADEVPSFYSLHERVAEIIDDSDAAKAIGRRHYRFYKDQGCTVHSHTISQ